ADPVQRPTPRVRGAVVTDAVEQVLEKALNIEPKHRYPDAGEFWDALVAAANLPATSARGMSGARSAVPITGPAPVESGEVLATGDFAVLARLDVQTDSPSRSGSAARGPASGSGLSMQSTMPQESLTEAPANKPMVVLHSPSSGAASQQQGPAT